MQGGANFARFALSALLIAVSLMSVQTALPAEPTQYIGKSYEIWAVIETSRYSVRTSENFTFNIAEDGTISGDGIFSFQALENNNGYEYFRYCDLSQPRFNVTVPVAIEGEKINDNEFYLIFKRDIDKIKLPVTCNEGPDGSMIERTTDYHMPLEWTTPNLNLGDLQNGYIFIENYNENPAICTGTNPKKFPTDNDEPISQQGCLTDFGFDRLYYESMWIDIDDRIIPDYFP